MAKPRGPLPPLPPLPDFAPALSHESFDQIYSYGMTNAEWVIPDYGTLRESWSLYALQRSGTVTPFILPALDSTGRTNVACDSGAVRLWVKPYWSSASLPGGAGPGTYARLMELVVVGNKQATVIFSLQISPDGSALELLGGSDLSPVVLLRAKVGWQAHEFHMLVLNYGSKTKLFIDGKLAAEGASTLTVAPQVAGMVIGSSLAGTDTIDGEVEEIYFFGRQLTDWGVACAYGFTIGQAQLGPISEAEEQARRDARAKWFLEKGSAGSPPAMMMAPTGCDTNRLWLEISTTTNTATLTLHNTQQNTNYYIWSKTNLILPRWTLETNMTGASGQTSITVPRNGRPELFFKAEQPDIKPSYFYVSPDGTNSNNGTITSPWPLTNALSGAGGAITNGSTVWLRGGTYYGGFLATLNGATNNYITFRGYPGERVTLDSVNLTNANPAIPTSVNTLTIGEPSQNNGNYVAFHDLEITCSRVDDRDPFRPSGVAIYGINSKLINCVVHDVGTGLGLWERSASSEIHGCLIYNYGWQDIGGTQPQGTGHGIYMQTAITNTHLKKVHDSIFCRGFGYGTHAYASGSQVGVNGFDVRRCATFYSGVLATNHQSKENFFFCGNQGNPCTNILLEKCYSFLPLAEANNGLNFELSHTAIDNSNLILRDSVGVGGKTACRAYDYDTIVCTGNRFYSPNRLNFSGTMGIGTNRGTMTYSNNIYYTRDVASGYIESCENYTVVGTNDSAFITYTGRTFSAGQNFSGGCLNSTNCDATNCITATTFTSTTGAKVYVRNPFRGPDPSTNSTGYVSSDWTTWTNFNSLSQTNFEQNSSWQRADPTNQWIYVHTNAYKPKRGHIIAYNFDALTTNASANSISVDVSSILSNCDHYVVRDSQNYYGPPVLEGTYTNSNITISLTNLTVAAPIGLAPDRYPPAGKLFNVFIIEGW